jgi:aminopeptidase N
MNIDDHSSIQRLIAYLGQAELADLARVFEQIYQSTGFGEVVVEIKNYKVHRILYTQSIVPSKSEQDDV